ncbi:SSI family serine proteinase inhibitor [Streptomyces sp. ISL-36]|uniref:SSI family serine proteinase inhibitor n=1 Tax=Streptomyces sp. ISL-36 TaxID=2819182 RepID=UPI0027E54FF2|nr:SSI family serine proteinase inhibitor [Streptomyces sp. ISL-36]
MRYLRSTRAATAFAAATGLAFVGTALTGSAYAEPAKPASLYPPSAIVLTLGQGESAATASVRRAVTLDCAPLPGGSHPSPAAACAELAAAGGDLGLLTAIPGNRPCTREWDPVTVTADGVWEGRRISWSATYGNACEMRSRVAEGAVFSF